jgi:hypothetical protein
MKENPFKRAIASHKQTSESVAPEVAPTDEELESMPETPVAARPATPSTPPTERKRGRPATGKRSDDAWIGRTYYVRRETDLDVEDALLRLKRQGIEVDKSELVDLLLGAWVKWQQGENIDIHISEITPRRNKK